MSRLLLTTKGIFEVLVANNISLNIVFDNKTYVVDIKHNGKHVLQLVLSLKSIDRTINLTKTLEPYVDNLRTIRVIRAVYTHVIREGIISSLIPVDIMQRHAVVVNKNERPEDWDFSNLTTITAINRRDNVYVEYRLTNITESMLGTLDEIKGTTKYVSDTSDLTRDLN
jgi:hypothetical protein